MKTYEELTSEILTKAKVEKKARKKRFIATASSAAGLCLVLSISLIAAHFSGVFAPNDMIYPSGESANISVADDYDGIYDVLDYDRYTYLDRIEDAVANLFSGFNRGIFTKDDIAEDFVYSADDADPESPVDYGEIENEAEMETTTGTSDEEYSDTNIQVEGIMEADAVKTDGEYIYVISSNKLFVISAKNGGLEKVSETVVFSGDTRYDYIIDSDGNKTFPTSEMYLAGDKIVLIYNIYNNEKGSSLEDEYQRYDFTSSHAAVYDVSDKSAPVYVDSFGISGDYLSSRMVGSQLYIVTSDRFDDYYIKKGKPETYIPSVYTNDDCNTVSAESVYYSDTKTECTYLNVFSIDVEKGEISDSLSLLGYGGSEIYQSASYLYAAASVSVKESTGAYVTKTSIAKVEIGDALSLVADGMVDGYLHNNFSMDEHNGYFRLVTTIDAPSVFYDEDGNVAIADVIATTYNNLYVLDPSLNIAGKIENLAPNERIYSARFDGDIAYFVTYRETDPLFCADLSDPENPVILSALKIPGFSEYLHKFTDDLLLGLGKTDMGTVKLSMFNISDKTDVTEEATEVFENLYYSEAATDHHAILVDGEKNLIGFPSIENYMVYSYNDGDFKREAILPMSSTYYDLTWTARGIYIGDYFYLCTPYSITSYALDDFTQISKVALTDGSSN